MSRHRHRIAELRVEPLESRVMLAAGDSPANLGLDVNWQTAIQGQDFTVELAPYSRTDNYFLKITGNGQGQLSVDLSQLPASVVNLQISSFESVILAGEHTVDNLILRDIDLVDAGRITIGSSLAGYNVEHIKIDEAPKEIVFRPEKLGEVGGKTLLEAGRMAPNTFIFSALDSLGIKSEAPMQQLGIVSGNVEQNIFLNSQPVNLGTPGARISIVSGDFDRYFFSTPVEQAALEQTPLVTKVLAIADYVPLANLLTNPVIRAVFAEFGENGSSAAHVRPDIQSPRLEAGQEPSESSTLMDFAANTGSLGSPSMANIASQAPLVEIPVQVQGAEATHADPTAAVSEPGALFSVPQTRSFAEGGLATLSLALARLSEPFVQTVLNLQARSASFGDIATAQFTQHLRADSRPALLVDTRVGKSREEHDIVVVNV